MTTSFDKLLGSKVMLRPFVANDITSDYISWLNDPEIVRYSNQRFIRHTEQSCRRYYDSFVDTSNLFISIRTLDTDLAIGTMTAYVSPHHGTADIGILIGRRSVWGTGVGQDSWDTLVSWFLSERQMRKVTAGAMRSNKAIIKVIERSGMKLEAIRPKQELLDGVPQDILYYGKFRDY